MEPLPLRGPTRPGYPTLREVLRDPRLLRTSHGMSWQQAARVAGVGLLLTLPGVTACDQDAQRTAGEPQPAPTSGPVMGDVAPTPGIVAPAPPTVEDLLPAVVSIFEHTPWPLHACDETLGEYRLVYASDSQRVGLLVPEEVPTDADVSWMTPLDERGHGVVRLNPDSEPMFVGLPPVDVGHQGIQEWAMVFYGWVYAGMHAEGEPAAGEDDEQAQSALAEEAIRHYLEDLQRIRREQIEAPFMGDVEPAPPVEDTVQPGNQ